MTNKLFNRSFNLTALLLALLFTGLYSCSEKITSEDATTITQANTAPVSARLKSASTTTSSSTTYTLWAGQTINAGTLVVSNDATNLYVTYNTTGVFGTLHLWAGTNLAGLPTNSQGVPVPGQFPYIFDASTLTTYQFTIPLSSISGADICGGNVYVVAHAEVTIGGNTETGFGGNIAGDSPRWYFYANYSLVDVVPPTASDAEPTTVACASEIPAPDVSVITDKADNCALAQVPVTFVDQTSTADGVCPKVITHNYLVTDAAGNSTAVKHTITVVDVTAPVWVLSSLPSKTVACEGALVFDVPEATDCNGYVLSSTDATAQPVIAGGFISISTTRTFYAADPCGNTSVALTQTITETCPLPTSTPCFETTSETAWAAGTRYVTKGSWATYVTYASGASINLYAGQNTLIGTATFSAVVGGQVTINVNITAAGWELVPGTDNVKVQGYAIAPKGNPSPGSFANKMSGTGSTATITVPAAKYYGVHLDVQLKVEVPCPETVPVQ